MSQNAPPQYSADGRWYWDGQRWIPVGPPAKRNSPGATVAVVLAAFVGILFLTSIVVIVILLTMGDQIKNVFSNVAVALNG